MITITLNPWEQNVIDLRAFDYTFFKIIFGFLKFVAEQQLQHEGRTLDLHINDISVEQNRDKLENLCFICGKGAQNLVKLLYASTAEIPGKVRKVMRYLGSWFDAEGKRAPDRNRRLVAARTGW